MAKCSDPVICERVLEVLAHEGTIQASGWTEVRTKLGYGIEMPLNKIKTAVGSLHFKQHRIRVARTPRYEEPMHDQSRGYRLSIV